ncbi:hypothetical protein F443_15945 [Phytophthora nicotianae P1569]|uniref:Uncharacterized protein n=1 Tax=Phytophthora nicotianae P1569 TaxID=1317065 RepID=V9EJP6_PHYNI|nr:hypothetical protein F443_15945 [Phytophthora nicotianae P1569]
MKPILKKLKAERSKEDHSSERDGAYTTHTMHQALQKWGKQLVYLNKKFNYELSVMRQVVATAQDGQGCIATERSSGPTMTKMSLKSGGSYR